MATGTAITPATFSGFLLPWWLEADPTASTLGQAGPLAGLVEPVANADGSKSALKLTATGPQDPTVTLNLTCNQGGAIGGAQYTWYRTVSGVDDAYERGADGNGLLVGFDAFGWASAATQRNPVGITLADGTQVVVAEGIPVSAVQVVAHIWDPDTATWSSTTIASGLSSSYQPYPCICQIPDPSGMTNTGILLCAFWNVNTTIAKANIDVYASRDQGATWALHSPSVLNIPLDTSGGAAYTPRRLRMAPMNGQILLLADVQLASGTSQQVILQFASSDAGASFSTVGTISDAGYPDIVVLNGIAYVGFLNAVVSASTYASIVTCGDAFTPITTAGAVDPLSLTGLATTTGTPYVFSNGELALVLLDSGLIGCYAIQGVAAGAAVQGRVSTFSTALNTGTLATSAWWYDGLVTSTEYPARFQATVYRGQVRLFCTMLSSSATYVNKLTGIYAGGATTITLPTGPTSRINTFRVGWYSNMLPVVTSNVLGATLTGAGTNSVATNTGWETFTTAANTRYATQAPATASASQQIWTLFQGKVDSGGGVSSRVVMAGLRAGSTGVYGFEFEVRCSTTQLRFRDVVAASDVATVTLSAASVSFQLLMAIDGTGMATVWYRETGADEDRYFRPLVNGHQLTDEGAASASDNLVTWGNRASGTAVSRWVRLGWNYAANITYNPDLAGGFTTPDDLLGVPFPLLSGYVASGTSIACQRGPAITGDAWTIPPDWSSAIRYLLPAGDPTSNRNVRGGMRPSPFDLASQWIATATTGKVQVRFPDAADRDMPPLFAMQIMGLNAAAPTVYGYSYDAAAYTSLGTLGNSVAGLAFLRTGATCRVDTGTPSSSNPCFYLNDLIGGYAILDDGAGNIKTRPILANQFGYWINAATRALASLTLGGIDGTEPTSGTLTVIYPSATFLFYAAQGVKYGAFALGWGSTPKTYESTPRGRILAVGPVLTLYAGVDWGTDYKAAGRSDVATFRSGARKGYPVRNAARRTLSIAATPLSTEQSLVDPTIAYQYWKGKNSGGYDPIGETGMNTYEVVAGATANNDQQYPIVYIPRIAKDTNPQTLVGLRSVGFYGRIQIPGYTDAYGTDTGTALGLIVRGEAASIEEEI